MATQHSKLFLIRPQVPAGKSKHPTAKHRSKRPKPQDPALTIERAFAYLQTFEGYEIGELDFERALRAIAFLLQWSVDGGNESLDGGAAYGLAVLVQQAANRAALLRKRVQS